MKEIDELEVLLINNKLFRSRLSKNENEESDGKIINLYINIIDKFSNGYDVYSDNFSSLFSVLSNTDNSYVYLLKVFLENYNDIYGVNIKEFDKSILGFSLVENDDLFDILRANFSVSSKLNVRQFFDEFDLLGYNDGKLKSLARLLYELIEYAIMNIDTEEEDLHNLLLNYSLFRQVSAKINQLEFFYSSAFMYLERWSALGYNQVARDFGATLLQSSFVDKLPEYGFLLSFYVASTQGNFIDGLICGTICVRLIKRKKECSSKYVFQFSNSILKLYRNRNLIDLVEYSYNEILSKVSFNKNEKIQIDFIYYSARLRSSTQDEYIESFLDYINKNIDFILERGEAECAPWLSMLYNIKRVVIAEESGFKHLKLIENLISLLEGPVKSNYLTLIKKVAEGDIETVKEFLKKLMVRVNETRHVDDFVVDIDKAISIADILIKKSFENVDVDGVILAMSVKADVSNEFKNEYAEVRINRKSNSKLKIFNQLAETKQLKSIISKNKIIAYLCISENQVYQMLVESTSVQMYRLKNWYMNKFDNWTIAELPNLKFNDTKRDKGRGTISQMFYEDYIMEEKAIKESIIFSKMDGDIGGELLLIKDMRLCAFPHNLLLGKGENFISLIVPVIDVINTDWIVRSLRGNNTLSKNYRIGMWLPLEGGDMTITYLASRFGNMLSEYNIDVYDSLLLNEPLSFDINIIVAHGDQDINSFAALHVNDNQSTTRLDRFVGEGSILIFFVCHSGSMRISTFSDKVESLVRSYLEKGYKTVIAPFWALNILIPPIWLPIFLSKLRAGESVSYAAFYANKEVYKYYPTPAAWACMHTYGCPDLKVENV